MLLFCINFEFNKKKKFPLQIKSATQQGVTYSVQPKEHAFQNF